MKILIVEDDKELARQLHAELSEDGHETRVIGEGDSALAAALSEHWDVAILDVTLPGISGFEIVRRLREQDSGTPVIFLTARGDIADRVKGLSLGADDYLTKPFSLDELKARLVALTRRRGSVRAASPRLPAGWKLNPLLRQVTIDGETVALQPREWSLLEVFLAHQGEVLNNSFLLDRVWGVRFDPGTNVVDAALCRLRRKLDRPGSPSLVETIRGRGHVFRRDV